MNYSMLPSVCRRFPPPSAVQLGRCAQWFKHFIIWSVKAEGWALAQSFKDVIMCLWVALTRSYYTGYILSFRPENPTLNNPFLSWYDLLHENGTCSIDATASMWYPAWWGLSVRYSTTCTSPSILLWRLLWCLWKILPFQTHRDSQTTSNRYNKKNRECVKCCHKSRQAWLSTSPAALRPHWIIKVILKVEIWKKEKKHLCFSNLALDWLLSCCKKWKYQQAVNDREVQL